MEDSRPGERNEVGAIARAVRVLEELADEDEPLGVSELARRTGISKSSVFRIANELDEHRLVERADRGYRLGLKLFELGQRVPRQRNLREAARPVMEDLREATRQTVHLAVLDGESVVYVEVLVGPAGPPLPTRAGVRWPAHATGIGKAILAHSEPSVVERVLAAGLPRVSERTITGAGLLTEELTRIVDRGVAYDLEESKPGLVCVASPVFGSDGRVVAGISVSGWHNRINLDHTAAAVRTAALGLSRHLRD